MLQCVWFERHKGPRNESHGAVFPERKSNAVSDGAEIFHRTTDIKLRCFTPIGLKVQLMRLIYMALYLVFCMVHIIEHSMVSLISMTFLHKGKRFPQQILFQMVIFYKQNSQTSNAV